MYGGITGQLHAPAALLPPVEGFPGTLRMGGSVGSRTGLRRGDEEKKIPTPAGKPLLSHYTDFLNMIPQLYKLYSMNSRMTVNDGLETMWKEEVVACFKIPSLLLSIEKPTMNLIKTTGLRAENRTRDLTNTKNHTS
jgi:hypothetical protein